MSIINRDIAKKFLNRKEGIDFETLAIEIDWIRGLFEQVDFVKKDLLYFDIRLVVFAKSKSESEATAI